MGFCANLRLHCSLCREHVLVRAQESAASIFNSRLGILIEVHLGPAAPRARSDACYAKIASDIRI